MTQCAVTLVNLPTTTQTTSTCSTTSGCSLTGSTTTTTRTVTPYPPIGDKDIYSPPPEPTDQAFLNLVSKELAAPVSPAPVDPVDGKWALNAYSDKECKNFVAGVTEDSVGKCGVFPQSILSYQYVSFSSATCQQGREVLFLTNSECNIAGPDRWANDPDCGKTGCLAMSDLAGAADSVTSSD